MVIESPLLITTYPLVMTNIAMENGPLIDGLPIKNGEFSMVMLNNQRVTITMYVFFCVSNMWEIYLPKRWFQPVPKSVDNKQCLKPQRR